MAINTNISGIKIDSSADNGKVPVFNSTTKEFDMTTASGGGASTALDNLSAVAINTSLVSDTDNTDDLGTTLKKWANLFVTTIGATATRVTKGWFTDIESTNMPTVGGTSLSSIFAAIAGSTGQAFSVSTLDVGNADTTLSRTGAGDIAVEGNAIYRAGGTDIPVTDGGTGRSTSTTAYGLIAAGTTATGAHQTLATGSIGQILRSGGASALPTYSTATYPDTAGTSGNVLTSDGTNWVSSAPTAPMSVDMSTVFESANRFESTVATGNGTITFNNAGVLLSSGNPAGSAKLNLDIYELDYLGSPTLSGRFHASGTGNATGAGEFYYGIGNITAANAGLTFTDKHIGVKVVKNLSNTYDVYGTCANGTTESTVSLGTMASGNYIDFIFRVNGTSSVSFSASVNKGTATTGTISTNLPTGSNGGYITWATSNKATGSQNYNWTLKSSSYTR